jgi:hypothetical protein
VTDGHPDADVGYVPQGSKAEKLVLHLVDAHTDSVVACRITTIVSHPPQNLVIAEIKEDVCLAIRPLTHQRTLVYSSTSGLSAMQPCVVLMHGPSCGSSSAERNGGAAAEGAGTAAADDVASADWLSGGRRRVGTACDPQHRDQAHTVSQLPHGRRMPNVPPLAREPCIGSDKSVQSSG